MEVFGYFAAAILLVTILTQMKTQWVRGTTKGVSRWLFIGQLLASVGFTIHSAAIGSTLFVVVNLILGVSAAVGIVMWFVLRRRERCGDAKRARTHSEHRHSQDDHSQDDHCQDDPLQRTDSVPSREEGLTAEVRA